jgi:hypothetical protein
MSSVVEDASFFSSVDLTTTLEVPISSDATAHCNSSTLVTPDSIESIADRAAGVIASDENRTEPFCIICRQTEPQESFKSSEHFIPEGLGLSWTNGRDRVRVVRTF